MMIFKKSIRDMKRSNFSILESLKRNTSQDSTSNKKSSGQTGVSNKLVNLLNDIEEKKEYRAEHQAKASMLLAQHKKREFLEDEDALLMPLPERNLTQQGERKPYLLVGNY